MLHPLARRNAASCPESSLSNDQPLISFFLVQSLLTVGSCPALDGVFEPGCLKCWASQASVTPHTVAFCR